jgi:anaerobic magnesium-protoporphyrin IX monomethyl ester cyclase
VRVLLINLPARTRLMRRYVASYYAPNFLVPPLELMGLGAVAARRPGWRVQLLDCVAEALDLRGAIDRARGWEPQVVIALVGFEVCGEDLGSLAELRRALPEAGVFCFGHLPSQLPGEVLATGACDGVLLDEPEHTFDELLQRVEEGQELHGLPGFAHRVEDEVAVGPARGRIDDLDALPWPDHSLVPLAAYRESFMPRPIGAVMTARGCPFPCTFCVRTHGREVRYRSAASIAEEVEALVGMGIRHVRFMDDTFTVDRARVLDLCDRLRRGPAVTWTALTRLKQLDEELLARMEEAGCRRLYVGVESGSQRILDLYRKGLSVEDIRRTVARIRRTSIEVSAFFIVGAPGETAFEVEASIQLALELEPDYVIVTRIQYWPGTELFRTHRDELEFSLVPTRCEPRARSGIPSHGQYLRWEQEFYRRFYLRPRYVGRRLATLARTPGDVVEGLGRLATFVGSGRAARDFI